MYIYHKTYVKFQITNETGKLKVKIKATFSKNVVAITNWNTVILKDVALMKSDIL